MTVFICPNCFKQRTDEAQVCCLPAPTGLFGNKTQDDKFKEYIHRLYRVIADNAKASRDHVSREAERVNALSESVAALMARVAQFFGSLELQKKDLKKTDDVHERFVFHVDERLRRLEAYVCGQINKEKGRVTLASMASLNKETDHILDALRCFERNGVTAEEAIKRHNDYVDKQREHNKLNPSRQHLEKTLAAKNQRIKELEHDLKDTRERLVGVRENLTKFIADNSQLKAALDDMRSQRDYALNLKKKECDRVCCLPPTAPHYAGCCL